MVIETGLIISFAAWLGSKIADKGFDNIYEKLTEKDEIDSKFKECIETVSTNLEKKYPDVLGNSINYFFTQDEVFDQLCKLLFINQTVNVEIICQSFDVSTLPQNFILEFINELKLELNKERIFQDLLANKEIYIAVKGISKDLNELSANSTLTYDEIKAIKEILEERFRDKFNLESFLSLYLKNIITNVGTINFIGLGIDPSIKKGKRKDLDKIFVKPCFVLKSKFHIEDETKCLKIYSDDSVNQSNDKTFSYSHLFDRPYNYVILGNPGAGKSLLVKSILLSIAKKQKIFSNEKIINHIPFKLELKNYLSFKKNKGGNILKYLAYVLEEEYSVPSVMEENLIYIFDNVRTIIFFDGLDEIFDVTDKLNVKNDIENFHNLFPKIRSITTSRFIGYNETKLNDEKFCELNIMSFNDEQIKEYVSKWYELEEENSDTRTAEISDFISKMVNVDSELLSNPLLLSLIVILFRNNLKIPDSKLEIYQSCTNTLVDKWDASKNLNIQINENILQKKEPIFSDLAFWQYVQLSSENTNITYYKAKATVTESLLKKKIADEDNCEQLAESFLNYAQKRSIYFENNFTHKTFLEYYTAYWIYSNIEKKHNIIERNNLINKYISNPFWYIVLELLLNMIDKDQPDTDIIDEIFELQLSNNASLPFLIYILPSLKNISKETSVKVYRNAILQIITKKYSNNNSRENLNDLFYRVQRNACLASQSEIINKSIDSVDLKYRSVNYYIFLNELFDSPAIFNQVNIEIAHFLKDKHYIETLKKDPYLYQIGSYNIVDNNIHNYFDRIIEYIDLFGKNKFFQSHHSLFETYSIGPFISFYWFKQLKKDSISSISENISSLNTRSISTISLIKYLLDDGRFISIDDYSIQFLLNKIIDEDQEQLKVLYVLILSVAFNKNNYRLKRSRKMENFEMSNSYQKLFKKIYRLNPQKAIRIIVAELNIKDQDILNLVNNSNEIQFQQ